VPTHCDFPGKTPWRPRLALLVARPSKDVDRVLAAAARHLNSAASHALETLEAFLRWFKRSVRMSTQQIAARLTELCGKGEFETAQRELFADNAVSIEQHETPAFPKETKGLQAIIKKGHDWAATLEQVHGCSTSKPLIAGNAIAMTLAIDVTMKGHGRMKLEEVCVYEVKDGKIISERFFM
jgi:limonene-1,2-epoxide hydrolase